MIDMTTELNLSLVKQACDTCKKCELSSTRTKAVVGRGNILATAMIVGEAPGADEDTSGLPFVGLSGQLLDSAFKSIGLDTNNDFYVTNTLKCRPPNNRPPTDDELLACMPHLERQIEILNPKFIVAVGNSALAWFSGEKGITKKRGKWFTYSLRERRIQVIPIYHPSFLLRVKYKKLEPKSEWRYTREDLKVIKLALETGKFQNAGEPTDS